MAANRVVLWRHGQTDWNVVNRFQGHSDIDLNEVGVFQAQHAAQILAGMNPTAIISSDLGRARNTAKALADITGLTVEIDPDLRETDGGLWEGKTGAENRSEDFQNFIRWIDGGLWEGKTGAENRAEDFQNFIRWIDGEDNPAGTTGERRSEVAERAIRAIKKALGDKTDQVLIVTTHGGTARCILGELLQLPLSHWGVIGGLSNASWSILERTPRQWILVEHNAGSIPEPVYGEESGATSA